MRTQKFFLTGLFVLISCVSVAQTPPPPIGDDPPSVSISGGVVFGIFFALAYGTSKLLKKNK